MQVFLLFCAFLSLLGQRWKTWLEKKLLTEQFYDVVVQKIQSQTSRWTRASSCRKDVKLCLLYLIGYKWVREEISLWMNGSSVKLWTVKHKTQLLFWNSFDAMTHCTDHTIMSVTRLPGLYRKCGTTSTLWQQSKAQELILTCSCSPLSCFVCFIFETTWCWRCDILCYSDSIQPSL